MKTNFSPSLMYSAHKSFNVAIFFFYGTVVGFFFFFSIYRNRTISMTQFKYVHVINYNDSVTTLHTKFTLSTSHTV